MSEILTSTLVRPADPADAGPAEEAPPQVLPSTRRGRARRAFRFFARRPGLVLSVAFVVVVLVATFAPGLLASGDPLVGVPADKLQPPSAEHLFGTDQIGRDLYTRVVHGAALSLQATVIAVGIGLAIGGLIGLLAGFIGRWVDEALMRLVDVLLAIPALLLSLALVTALGYGTVKVAIAVGLAELATFARVMRSEVLRVRSATYVEAARAVGTRWHVTLARHVLPNAIGPVLVLAVLQFGVAILAVSSLSFLGYGAAPPAPEWGSLVSAGRNYLASAWWLSAMPGLTVVATVLSVNRISRALDGEWGRAR